MFHDTNVRVLDGDFKFLCVIACDMQPYDKAMQMGDDIQIQITKHAFCDVYPAINPAGYFYDGKVLFKIIKIVPWSDYLEIWLYESERGLPCETD